MSKRTLSLLTVLMLLALVLGACQQATATTVVTEVAPPAEADCADEATVCIGLVTDVGTIDDKSFNQSAWEGANAAAEELDAAKIEYIETKDAKDYATNIGLFAGQNYDIIITVGFALGGATIEAAAAYPNIDFIGVDQFQPTTIANVTGILFPEDQSGFLAGALAAMMSESGTVAAVLGTDLVPPVVAFNVGYANGAAYINPDITVIATYHPGGLDVAFNDPEWGATTARQAIDQGADVVFGAGGNTGNGALIEAASEGGAVYCIGVDSDQWETVPEAHPCLISSAMKLITPAVHAVILSSVNGTFTGGHYFGGAGLAPFHDFDAAIPQEVKDTLAEIDAALKDGSLTTGYVPGG